MRTFVERIHALLAGDAELAARMREFSTDPETRCAAHGPLLIVLPAASRLIRCDEERALLELEARIETRFHRFQGGDDPVLLLAVVEERIRTVLWDSRLPDGAVDYLDEAPLRVISAGYEFPLPDGKSANQPYRLAMRASGGKFYDVA